MTRRTRIFFLLTLLSGPCFSQESETLINKIYDVVNASFPDPGDGGKTRLLDTPLALSRLNDTLLQSLVARNKISAEETSYILSQARQPVLQRWDQSRLHHVNVVKFSANRKHYPRHTYGASLPVFSQNGNLAILYVQNLGSDGVHTAILVYECMDGKWKFLISLLSEIS